MERGQKYLNIISLYDDAELRQQLESSLAEEISTITASESKMDEYLKNIDNVELKDKIHTYEDFLTEVISQFAIIQGYVDKGDFVQAGIALGVDFQNQRKRSLQRSLSREFLIYRRNIIKLLRQI